MRRLGALLGTLGAVACVSVAGAAAPGPASDVRAVAQHLESSHPNLFHAVPRQRFRAAVTALEERADELAPDQLLVELMRLGALPGVRDGHGGIYPLDSSHARELHLLPIRLYEFPEGVHVVAEVGRHGLVGDRLVAIAGVPIAEVLRRVRPLVPHDNRWSRDARAMQWLLVTEVLHGLGVTDTAGRQRLTFERRGGGRREIELAPIGRERWSAAFPDFWNPLVVQGLPWRAAPAYLAERNRPWHTALLDRGRAAYAAYNVTQSSSELARELGRLAARPGVRRVILDLRLNPGGDVFTYAPLLTVLRSPKVNRPGRLYVLIARSTFSAAGLLAAELERLTRAVFVGEPTGSAPNLYADPAALRLPANGWNFMAATRYWQKSTANDPRLALRPDLPVALTAADFFAGRDPVLARVLR